MPGVPLDPSGLLAWGTASLEACQAGSERIEPIHLLGSILKILDNAYQSEAEQLGFSADSLIEVEQGANIVRQSLALSAQKMEEIRRGVRRLYLSGATPRPPELLHRSPQVRAHFDIAASAAVHEGAAEVTVGHLLASVVQRPPPEAEALLAALVANAASVLPQPMPGLRAFGEEAAKDRSTRSLDALGRDLTRLAREGRLSPVVGRHGEILQVARALHRVSKRSVLIVGEAGVGKTAVVEGLAQHLASKDAPEKLASLRIIELPLGNLIAGTRYRGDLEERLRAVLDEAKGDPNLVLFLDEVHLAVGGGSAEGATTDIANLLKPALGRGEIRCIGSTTESEFDRYIKSDAAFMRRFSLVRIKEPSREAAMEITRAWALRIAEAQGIEVSDDAVQAAVDLSVRFVRDRFLPDKSIELLDSAAARAKVATLTFGGQIPAKVRATITRTDIEAVLQEQLGAAVRLWDLPTREDIEQALRNELVGQEVAIAQIADVIAGVRVLETDHKRPLAVILLTGPTGVGKTASAAIVGRTLSGEGEKGTARFSMNEYKERWDLSRLIGAAPGLIGHDAQGPLFAFAHSHPQGAIILDEAEKAHPEVMDFFLEIFDTGEARDSRGRTADFRGIVFFLTCNLETAAQAARTIGFTGVKEAGSGDGGEAVRQALTHYFRPEFVARIDRVVEFRELAALDYEALFDRRLGALREQLMKGHTIELELSPEARKELLQACSDQTEGARGFIRRFEALLANPVLEHARDQVAGAGPIQVAWRGETLSIGP